MNLPLENLRNCLEGAIPSMLATCDAEGLPNLAYLSQVQYVDPTHVALTFQFFNTTRRNILANPNGTLMMIDPETAGIYRLKVRYQRTETEGPLFESMKAKLAGIASHTGMAEIFKLRGSDIYEVLAIEQSPGKLLGPRFPRANWLPILRQAATRLAACADMNTLFDETLNILEQQLAIHHAMILMLDERGSRLYTVASRGYANTGVGSEIPVGHGVIGVAARERTPIRITYRTSDYAYGKAVRDSAVALGMQLEQAIPMPGLADCHSQLAVPIAAGERLHGILYVESPQDFRFCYEDEDGLMTIATHMALAIPQLATADTTPEDQPVATAPTPLGPPVQIKHYSADHSVFLNDDYLIKGVAGAIFWRLVQAYTSEGRDTFSNRELRLDPALGLPDIADNLEARLVLLQRRLADREACVRMEKAGRGRFRLVVNQPLSLHDLG